jgi:hypothetical protein
MIPSARALCGGNRHKRWLWHTACYTKPFDHPRRAARYAYPHEITWVACKRCPQGGFVRKVSSGLPKPYDVLSYGGIQLQGCITLLRWWRGRAVRSSIPID